MKIAEELANKEDYYLLSVLYNNIGNTYLQKNGLYNAEKYYTESLKIDEEYIYPILGIAILYMKKYEESKNDTEYKKSLEMFDSPKKIDNNFDGIYYNESHLYNIKASISNNENDYLYSIKLLDKAIECAQLNNNNKSLYYYAKGIVYNNLYNLFKKNEYKDKVITSYLLSIELNKDDFNPYYNLANFYDSIGNKTEAINYYTKAISINPEHESSYNNRALVSIDLQEYDKAIIDINKILEINPNNFGAYYNLGVIYAMQNKIQLAIECFYRCVNSVNNKDKKIKMNSYYNLGILKGRMGDNESAINDIIKSYELGNENCLNIIKEEAYKYNNKIAISYLNGKII
ncbi:tetratricopeptide repeat protein [uncultured Brachyspira sp.]|uniref:tetratricopeptide repeat protein n=1 Tax=uncultured Brachyspira sp. TaxID=221953 RepID=UPI0025EEE955|nr:tetratricopeptide repeat protein [uncultured Brachyspira sp.]